MRKLFSSLLAGLCLSLSAFGSAPNGYTTLTALQIVDASGQTLRNGTAYFTPVDASGNPISVRVGGIGGQMLTRAAQTQVVNGVMSVTLADTSLTTPSNVCYHVQVFDNANRKVPVLDIPCVQPNGVNYDLDNYSTSTSPILPITSQVYSGNLNIIGNLTVTGNISGNIQTTGAISAGSVDAPTMTQGGLPLATVRSLGVGLNNANSGGSAVVGVSSDLTYGSENGVGEKFFADFHAAGTNSDGSMLMPGFETQANSYSRLGHFNCSTCTNSSATPAYLVRALTFTGDPSWTIQGTLLYGSNTLNCIGLNNAAFGTFVNPTAAGFIGTCFTASGWTIYNGGVVIATPGCGSAGNWYDMSLMYLNGHLRASCVALFTSTGVTDTVDNVTPPSGLANFEVTSSAVGDESTFVRYSVGGGPGSTNTLNLPFTDRTYNQTVIFTDTTAGTIWGLIPHNYHPGLQNRWVLYEHGYNEVGWNITGGPNTGVGNVAQSLANAGYVVIGMNNTQQNCYGDAQCVTDVQTVINEVTSLLSLAPQPYMFADSMGGFTMLSAMMHGAVHPRAIAGMCANTNLAWDYQSGGAQPIIDTDYGTPYATTTAGYDPMLASGQALQNLLVPTMLWSSYADTTVLRTQNTDAYASMINAIVPGLVTVNTSTGQHEDLSNFNGPAVVTFFNTH